MQGRHENGPVRNASARASGRAGERGMSLVELMLATVLVVVCFVAIMDACIRLHSLQRLDDELGHAYRACRTNLEQMHTMRLADLLRLDDTGFEVAGADGVTPVLTAVPGDADGLPGHIHVVQERLAGGRAIYRIEASVQWRGANGDHTVVFTTMWGGVP